MTIAMTDNDFADREPTEVQLEFGEFFHAMLRDAEGVDDMVCDGERGLSALHHLLILGILGLALHGLALGVVIHLATPALPLSFATQGMPLLWVPLALVGGFLSSIAICLPSFYFYTQLSGLDASFRLVTAQSLRVQARTSVLLLGILPFYLAWALSSFLGISQIDQVVALGFIIPFLMGFAGLYSVYQSFRRLAKKLPITHTRRGQFVLRLVLCWGAVTATVAPVAVFRLAQTFSGVL